MKPKQVPAPDDLLTVTDAAQVLSVSTETIRRYHKAGRLPAQRTPKGIHIFKRRDLEKLAAERAAATSKRSVG
jgi:excisionase family DNA binding protein